MRSGEGRTERNQHFGIAKASVRAKVKRRESILVCALQPTAIRRKEEFREQPANAGVNAMCPISISCATPVILIKPPAPLAPAVDSLL